MAVTFVKEGFSLAECSLRVNGEVVEYYAYFADVDETGFTALKYSAVSDTCAKLVKARYTAVCTDNETGEEVSAKLRNLCLFNKAAYHSCFRIELTNDGEVELINHVDTLSGVTVSDTPAIYRKS